LTDSDIIQIDRTEFGEDEDGVDQTKFSDETKEAIKDFARPIFEDSEYGLAK
jgi:hypothetical protein